MKAKKIVVLLALILLVPLISSACTRKAEAPPKQVVGNYLKYLVKRDYKQAYSLCSREFRKKIALDDFALVNKRLRLGGIVYSEPAVIGEEIIGNKAVVEYKLEVKGGPMGSRRTFKGSARLTREDSKWRIEKVVGMPKEWLEKQ